MIDYDWDFQTVFRYRHLFIDALGTTLSLSILVVAFGVIAGLVLAGMRRAHFAPFVWFATIFTELVRAVPPLVLLVWIYYCMPILLGLSFSAYTTTVVALGLYSAAFYAEIFRAGAQSIEKGLLEAGLSVGMTRPQSFRRITAPLAFQRILPPFVSQCVLVIKNTSLGSYIAVQELLYQGQRVSIETFRPIEVLSTVAVVFIVIIVPLSTFANIYEKRHRTKFGL